MLNLQCESLQSCDFLRWIANHSGPVELKVALHEDLSRVFDSRGWRADEVAVDGERLVRCNEEPPTYQQRPGNRDCVAEGHQSADIIGHRKGAAQRRWETEKHFERAKIYVRAQMQGNAIETHIGVSGELCAGFQQGCCRTEHQLAGQDTDQPPVCKRHTLKRCNV